MAGELNSVQESIKLALDAADAATDVTSEYSQVKREHKKLERKVSQIHRYTTITFITGVAAAAVALAFSATLYLLNTYYAQNGKSNTVKILKNREFESVRPRIWREISRY